MLRLRIAMAQPKTPRQVLILQVDYAPGGTIDVVARDLLSEAVVQYGFEPIDYSGSRVAFTDGNFARFKVLVKREATRLGIKVKRVLQVPDPGLGLMLNFPEDQVRLDNRYTEMLVAPEGELEQLMTSLGAVSVTENLSVIEEKRG